MTQGCELTKTFSERFWNIFDVLFSAGKQKPSSRFVYHCKIRFAALRGIILSLEVTSQFTDVISLSAARWRYTNRFRSDKHWKAVRGLRSEITKHQK